MADMTARVRFLRIAPRKVRLVADMIRGKKVSEARIILEYTVKRSAPMLSKLLLSAVANIESQAAEKRQRVNTDDMIISEVFVDGGPTGKRFQPQPRGRASKIRRRTSHITLSLLDVKKKK